MGNVTQLAGKRPQRHPRARRPNRRPDALPITWTRYQSLLSEASASLHAIGVTPDTILGMPGLDPEIAQELAGGIACLAAGELPVPAAYFR